MTDRIRSVFVHPRIERGEIVVVELFTSDVEAYGIGPTSEESDTRLDRRLQVVSLDGALEGGNFRLESGPGVFLNFFESVPQRVNSVLTVQRGPVDFLEGATL